MLRREGCGQGQQHRAAFGGCAQKAVCRGCSWGRDTGRPALWLLPCSLLPKEAWVPPHDPPLRLAVEPPFIWGTSGPGC